MSTNRYLRSLAALLLALCACVGSEVGAAAGAISPGIDLRLDFETGDGSQFSGLECPHAGTQFEVYDASATSHPAPRQGRYAARFSETPVDVWPGNDIVRCLGARNDSGESAGDDFYYALSVYVPPAGLSDNLIWELHHPSSLYKLAGCGVAPFALHARNDGLDFRIVTGNCVVGSGNAYREPNLVLPGLERLPRSTWIDIVLHVVFSESNGRVELWYRTDASAFPVLPQLARYAIPTLPWADSAGVHDVTLYTELGLYAGRTGYAASDSVYLDGYRRGTSMDAVLAEFARAAGAPVAPPSTPPPAAADAGPPSSVEFVDADVRVIVTAANAGGASSMASGAVSTVAATVAAPSALIAPIVSGTPATGEPVLPEADRRATGCRRATIPSGHSGRGRDRIAVREER